MYNFKYVAKREFMPLKNELIELIHQVQDQVRDYFTFRFDFVGSSQRNMITSDNSSNVGFDFDVNIQVNDDDEEYGPKEIKHILMNGFNEILKTNNSKYDYCEDSTRVFTIKVKDNENSKIIHSVTLQLFIIANMVVNNILNLIKNKILITGENKAKGFINYQKNSMVKN